MAAATGEALFLIKDVKPGSKNLNIVFIVLEIGKLVGKCLSPYHQVMFLLLPVKVTPCLDCFVHS